MKKPFSGDCRGCIFRASFRQPGGFSGISPSPPLFAACHSEQGLHGVIAAWVYGLVAALLYVRLRSLWPLVFGHFVIDMIEFWPNPI
ncbi:CPBP family intramembrane glutamic endopeptidase [Methylomagnum sp.]